MENNPLIPTDLILDFLNLAKEHNLEELTINAPEGDFYVSRAETVYPSAQPIEIIHSSPIPLQKPQSDDNKLFKVISPLVGVFYRGSSPGSKPFVEAGDTVAPGEPLCIIEAMKVMNEVVSDAAGVIESVMVEKGRVVEVGEILFLIRKNS